jgi:hypothetical protein
MGMLKQIGKSLVYTLTLVLTIYGIFKLMKNANIFSIQIPDWIILTSIVFLFFLFGNMAVYFSKHSSGSQENDSTLKAELEGFKKDYENYRKAINKLETELREKIAEQGQTIALIYNSPYDHIKLEPTEEILFLLGLLAAEKEKSLTKSTLNGCFLTSYGRDKQAEYNILIDKLENYDFIRLPDLGYSYEDPYYTITSKGLAYYERTRKKAAP